MTIDKSALKALAEAAPEGPWFGPEYAPGTSYVFDVDLGTLLEYQSIDTEKDACLRYVAAANPATILALLAEIDALRFALKRIVKSTDGSFPVDHRIDVHVSTIELARRTLWPDEGKEMQP